MAMSWAACVWTEVGWDKGLDPVQQLKINKYLGRYLPGPNKRPRSMHLVSRWRLGDMSHKFEQQKRPKLLGRCTCQLRS